MSDEIPPAFGEFSVGSQVAGYRLEEQTGITSQGQVLGTLDHVAPEQIECRAVDGRTDLYALACAAFELLSGAPSGRTLLATDNNSGQVQAVDVGSLP